MAMGLDGTCMPSTSSRARRSAESCSASGSASALLPEFADEFADERPAISRAPSSSACAAALASAAETFVARDASSRQRSSGEDSHRGLAGPLRTKRLCTCAISMIEHERGRMATGRIANSYA